MLPLWQIQLLGLAALLGFFKFLESTAGMRGTGGEDSLGPLLHRVMRVCFLTIIWGGWVYSQPLLLPLFLAYLFTYLDLSELNGGRAKVAAGWRVWGWLRDYFPLELHKTVELDPRQQYVFGIHPHGVLPFGSAVALQSHACGFHRLFPGLQHRTLAASICFYVPGYRDLVLAGGVVDASRFSARGVLRSGQSVSLVPGGATEALYADPKKDVLVLRKRAGFIKLAMQHGASLVPIFGFNENNTYEQWWADNATVDAIKKKYQAIFGMSLPLIKNIIPRRAPIHVVVGAPIKVEKVVEPSREQVNAVMEEYIAGLQELFATHGPRYNVPKHKELEII